VSQLKVRYDYGFNTSGTGQHEVLEYVITTYATAVQGGGNAQSEEGPYVVLYTEQKETAVVIAAILNVDGTDNNFPLTPLAQQYAKTEDIRPQLGVPWRPWERYADSTPGEVPK
jgi:hypothetical protein